MSSNKSSFNLIRKAFFRLIKLEKFNKMQILSKIDKLYIDFFISPLLSVFIISDARGTHAWEGLSKTQIRRVTKYGKIRVAKLGKIYAFPQSRNKRYVSN